LLRTIDKKMNRSRSIRGKPIEILAKDDRTITVG
jgi:hypothetical protein